MAKKHKLSVSMEEDYCLLGVVSDEPDYKFCWLINQELGTLFTRMNDLVLYNKKLGEDQAFNLFHYDDEKRMLTYRIIANKTGSGYYLPELKQIDYLFHIQGEVGHQHVSALISQVSGIQSVRMCVPVDLTRIRNRERLQLW